MNTWSEPDEVDKKARSPKQKDTTTPQYGVPRWFVFKKNFGIESDDFSLAYKLKGSGDLTLLG